MAEAEGDASQARDSEAGICTETLARLYLKQGFVERALAIYRRLAQEQPDNHQLYEHLYTLEQEFALGGLGQDAELPSTVPHGAVDMGTSVPRPQRQEHHVVVQLERWLHYLQMRQR